MPPSGIGIRTSVAIAWGSLRRADLHTRHFYWACSVSPKFVSPSDPAARWTGAMRGPAPELRRNRLHAKLPTWWRGNTDMVESKGPFIAEPGNR